MTASPNSQIELRGVEVHNLRQIDLDIPRQKLVVFCGVSGSGKTSLALDTLYAEGQRRYIESFSVYTRQFLERLEKPAAERIDGIPPSIAVTQKAPSRSSRANIGTATEVLDYLRLLFAKIGTTFCYECGKIVQKDNPDTVVDLLTSLDAKARYMVTFPVDLSLPETTSKAEPEEGFEMSSPAERLRELKEDGFVRMIFGDTIIRLDETDIDSFDSTLSRIEVVVDRLTGSTDNARVRDSLETAFAQSFGRAVVFVSADTASTELQERGSTREIEGRSWLQINFNKRMVCDTCDITYPTPTPKLFSFNSPLGAVLNAKVSAIWWALTWIWWCQIPVRALRKTQLHPGVRRPTPMNLAS